MIQDDNVSPGYCLLQLLRHDAPLPQDEVLSAHHIRDIRGRILMKNTMFDYVIGIGAERHGPAYTKQGISGCRDMDIVHAFKCKTWPVQAQQWLNQLGIGQWPSNEMRQYCSTTGCFVVPVGSKGSVNEKLEWRISTSLAERCLVFNLNITQIQCYILMKMILKTKIKPQFGDAISTFMCKTILIHCSSNADPSIWTENNLLGCLSLCLVVLYRYVSNENCPHLFIPRNNLMTGHILSEIKPRILEILQHIVISEGRVLLEIECDSLGKNLTLKLNGLYGLLPKSLVSKQKVISGSLLQNTALSMHQNILFPLLLQTRSSYDMVVRVLLEYILRLVTEFNVSQGINKRACCLLASWFCASLGTILASYNIGLCRSISQEALNWISLGLNFDVSSCKLKVASMLYCTEDIQRAEVVIRHVEENYNLNTVEPICGCSSFPHRFPRGRFNDISFDGDEETMKHTTAFCVHFLPCEINLVPKELRYEMFRLYVGNLAQRGRSDNLVVSVIVDSLPYLYFLQYKTYGYLRRHEEKQRALSNLAWAIESEPNLGHKEISFNLLGQCLEQQHRAIDALHCYSLSLSLQQRHNAAKIHICRLLSAMVNHQ